jgi:hypothetical protein
MVSKKPLGVQNMCCVKNLEGFSIENVYFQECAYLHSDKINDNKYLVSNFTFIDIYHLNIFYKFL